MAFKMKNMAYWKAKADASPLRQEGPVSRQNPKVTKSEEKRDPELDKTKGFGPVAKPPKKVDLSKMQDRIQDMYERISSIKQDASAAGEPLSNQQKKDVKNLTRELNIMRKRYTNITKKKI
jgi:hypothetical protein